jgi:uncharacterized damage-inducible protein DinB
MTLHLEFDELLRYSNDEREKWRGWLLLNPAAMEVPVQPSGRHPTVGKLIDHIFLVERRHLQRLTGDPVAESTGLTGNNAPPLFDYGASVRRELEQYTSGLDEDVACDPQPIVLRDRTLSISPRKLLFHILLHEIRHWAQIALAVRQAGMAPPGDHDLIYSRAVK